jgi:hypothetical protein
MSKNSEISPKKRKKPVLLRPFFLWRNFRQNREIKKEKFEIDEVIFFWRFSVARSEGRKNKEKEKKKSKNRQICIFGFHFYSQIYIAR